MVDGGDPLVGLPAALLRNHLYLTAFHQPLEYHVNGGQRIRVVGKIKPFGLHPLLEFSRAQRDVRFLQSDASELGQTRREFNLGSVLLGRSITQLSAEAFQMADEGLQPRHPLVNLLPLPQQVGQLSFAGLQVAAIRG